MRDCDQSERQELEPLDDQDLVVRVQAGDEDAMGELYRRHSGSILSYFRKMLGTQEAAEDALQELFLKVIHGADSIDPNRAFSTWLFGVAHHMCCNEYRSRQVRLRALDGLRSEREPNQWPEMERALDETTFRQLLAAELGRLSPEHRSTFLLRIQEGLSLRQIGTIVGVPTGTVKSRLHAACQQLAERLGGYVAEIIAEAEDDQVRRQL